MSKKRKSRPKASHHPSEFGLEVMQSDDDMFRWFLLCFMLGKPIQSTVALKTWQLFIDKQLDTPWAILSVDEHKLARVLQEGKYTRYQHVMARSLHICMEQLLRDYEGSVLLMIESSASQQECNKRLQTLHGVGPKTAEIILRGVDENYFVDSEYRT